MKDPLFSLKGRTALVTGSSRGIGRSIALLLGKAGARVVVHGVGPGPAADEVLRELEAHGAGGFFVPGDLALTGGGRALAEAVLQVTDTVDVIVLNASVQVRKPWLEIGDEEIALQMRTNFQASLEILQVLVPGMRTRKWGRVLTVGSVQQVRPHPQMLPYAASKAAQMNLVLNLAGQLAADGITVNNLAPGVILTDRNNDSLSDAAYADSVRQRIPAKYFGEPDDCAGAALLLCSEAGRYITGADLYIDGGLSLR